MVRRSEGAESQPSLSAALSPRNGELEPEAGQSLSLKRGKVQVSRSLLSPQPSTNPAQTRIRASPNNPPQPQNLTVLKIDLLSSCHRFSSWLPVTAVENEASLQCSRPWLQNNVLRPVQSCISLALFLYSLTYVTIFNSLKLIQKHLLLTTTNSFQSLDQGLQTSFITSQVSSYRPARSLLIFLQLSHRSPSELPGSRICTIVSTAPPK